MKIPNADYLECTGSENIGARLAMRCSVTLGERFAVSHKMGVLAEFRKYCISEHR